MTGVIDPNFQPNVNSFWGVWSIDAGNGTLAVGGEFTNFDGVAVQGVALLPSLFANDHTPPTDPDEPHRDRPHVDDRQPLVERLDRQHPAVRLPGLP